MWRIRALMLACVLAGPVSAQGSDRFELRSLEVAPAPVTEDGRFTVKAAARLAPEAASRERFRLKTALVDCGTPPPAPPLLVDSFEG